MQGKHSGILNEERYGSLCQVIELKELYAKRDRKASPESNDKIDNVRSLQSRYWLDCKPCYR
jgi:hypothetical protein